MKPKAFQRKTEPYERAYFMWKNKLRDCVISKFNIRGNRNKIHPFFSNEAMKYLCLYGAFGVVELSGALCPTPIGEGEQSGIFFDQWDTFTFYTPQHTGERKNGVNGGIVYATPSHLPIDFYIKEVASQLAHLDVTISTIAINMREEEIVYTAGTDKGKAMLEERRKALWQGRFKPIVDTGFTSLKTFSTSKTSHDILRGAVEARDKLLDDFYNTIGIKTNTEKRANLIVEEVNANDDKLLFNSYIFSREIMAGLERVNRVFPNANLKLYVAGEIEGGSDVEEQI